MLRIKTVAMVAVTASALLAGARLLRAQGQAQFRLFTGRDYPEDRPEEGSPAG